MKLRKWVKPAYALATCLMLLNSCDVTDGVDGKDGIDGKDGADGVDGTSIVWQGESDTVPANPKLNWAYYNTDDKVSYIFTGTVWDTMSVSTSFMWKGESETAPANPEKYWAYYNSAEGISYIFDGTNWVKLAQMVDLKENFVLQLLHFSDVDGNEEIALSSVDEFASLVNAFRSDSIYGSRSLLVSSGDHIIQGPRFYAAERIKSVTGSDEPGSADIALMNAMGVDVATIGNHDLDAGPSELQEAINKDIDAVFPHVSANIDFEGENFTIGLDGAEAKDMAGQVARFAVVTIAGEKVGVVGAVTPTLPTITSVGNLSIAPHSTDASASELAMAIQPAVDILTARGVNKIVLLAHMQQIAVEKDLAEKLYGVDVIVAGGSNTRMGDSTDALYPGDLEFDETYPFETIGLDGNPTLVVNVDGDYKYLGRLVVEFDKSGVILTDSLDAQLNGAYASEGTVVASVGGTANATVESIQGAIQGVIEEQYGNIVGYSSVYLDGRRSQVRTQETNLGNLTADANLWYANQLYTSGVDISLKNGGGIRTEIGAAYVAPGGASADDIEFLAPEDNAISEGHLRATLRFDNGLVLLSVTPPELVDLLEHAVAATEDGATPGQFPQIGGMRITYDAAQPARTDSGTGSRIRELEILNSDGTVKEDVVTAGELNGELSESYRLVTLNFLANGGDNYPFGLLSAPDRINLYEGPGYGEDTDYPDAELTNDPGKNSSFSYTGGEQDALAEYLQNFHASAGSAFESEETDLSADTRIIKQ